MFRQKDRETICGQTSRCACSPEGGDSSVEEDFTQLSDPIGGEASLGIKKVLSLSFEAGLTLKISNVVMPVESSFGLCQKLSFKIKRGWKVEGGVKVGPGGKPVKIGVPLEFSISDSEELGVIAFTICCDKSGKPFLYKKE